MSTPRKLPINQDVDTNAHSQKPAAVIPNLLETLRTGKSARSALRNSSTPLSSSFAHPPVTSNSRSYETAEQRRDRIVQQTDDDAAGSRLSAVDLGYVDDPFAGAFSVGNTVGTGAASEGRPGGVRRMPIINRGTYVRTTAIDTLVSSFLTSHAASPMVQIISLGAGTDTRFFRLMRTYPELRRRLCYHEIDFPATTRKKIAMLEKSPDLMALVKGDQEEKTEEKERLDQDDSSDDTITEAAEPSPNEDIKANDAQLTGQETFHSPAYNIHALDLRSLSSIPFLHSTVPTLLLSEMCLTYLPSEFSNSLLHTITHTLLPAPTSLEILLYEPLHPTTPFGRTMIANLAGRGIALPGLSAFPTLNSHGERLLGADWEGWEGWTVKEWWEEKVNGKEKGRLRELEFVDEEEEWELLAGHYGIIRGWRGERPGR